METLNKVAADKEKIKRLLRKCEIKTVSGLDDSREITEIIDTTVAHKAPDDVWDEYVKEYTEIAVSLLNEPLSDIPMGQAVQFSHILETMYRGLKKVFEKYKQGFYGGEYVLAKFKTFFAVSEYLSDVMIQCGDQNTTYIPELDKVEYIIVDYVGCEDINVYIDAVEKSFIYYDALINVIKKAVKTNDKANLNASAICLGIQGMYMSGLVEYIGTH